jgi:hypothetical protein
MCIRDSKGAVYKYADIRFIIIIE